MAAYPDTDLPAYGAVEDADLPLYDAAGTDQTDQSTDHTTGQPTGQPAELDIAPAMYVLRGQAIGREADPATPLYQLNRGIAQLGPAAAAVILERIETHPSGRARPRHLYTLCRQQQIIKSPTYYAQAVSSRALGSFGLRDVGLAATRTEAVPVHTRRTSDQPLFVRDAPPLFVLRRQPDAVQWVLRVPRVGGAGLDHDCAVAVEYVADSQHRLLVTAPLPRATLDALVALWCCRIWAQSVERVVAQGRRTATRTTMPSRSGVRWGFGSLSV